MILLCSTETFDDCLQAMEFAQAKIHSLLMNSSEEGVAGGVVNEDPVTMKFKEVEARFLEQFSMPKQEKLVNCTSNVWVTSISLHVMTMNFKIIISVLAVANSSCS